MNKDDFYLNHALGGFYSGRTLIQASGKIGGHRSVFVNIVGNGKNALTYPTFGGILVNPFKGRAKIYAGDVFEFDPGLEGNNGATVKILKYYEVAKSAGSETAKTILLKRDGYRHIPFVGDVIMVAPNTFEGTGTAVTITAVESTTDTTAGDVWKVTVSATLGNVAANTILVEAVEAGSEKKPVVTNPNTYADMDMDFFYEPKANPANDEDGASYLLTPALANEDTILNLKKVNTLPPALLALNKSRIKGWFNL